MNPNEIKVGMWLLPVNEDDNDGTFYRVETISHGVWCEEVCVGMEMGTKFISWIDLPNYKEWKDER